MTAQMPWEGLDLNKLTALQQRVFDAAYCLGFAHGIEHGRRQADTEAAAAWAPIVRHVRGLGAAGSRTHAQLTALRADVSTGRPTPTPQECDASWGTAPAERWAS